MLVVEKDVYRIMYIIAYHTCVIYIYIYICLNNGEEFYHTQGFTLHASLQSTKESSVLLVYFFFFNHGESIVEREHGIKERARSFLVS